MYLNVVFDLDGTLLDTLQDLAAAGNHTLSALGLPTHPVDNYKKMVGNGIPMLIQRMLPENHQGKATHTLALSMFEKYYAAHLREFTHPYPGIKEILAELRKRGVALAVASNKADHFTRQMVNDFFPGTFAAVAGKREGLPAKPEPAIVFKLMQALGATANNTLYVGDSDVDMHTARNAALPACGVLWGFRGHEELAAAGAGYLVHSPRQLCDLILTGVLQAELPTDSLPIS